MTQTWIESINFYFNYTRMRMKSIKIVIRLFYTMLHIMWFLFFYLRLHCIVVENFKRALMIIKSEDFFMLNLNYTKLYEAEVKLVWILINENIINNLPQEMHSRCFNDHDCSFDSNLFRRHQKHFDLSYVWIRCNQCEK